jgi:hypothetical protein
VKRLLLLLILGAFLQLAAGGQSPQAPQWPAIVPLTERQMGAIDGRGAVLWSRLGDTTEERQKVAENLKSDPLTLAHTLETSISSDDVFVHSILLQATIQSTGTSGVRRLCELYEKTLGSKKSTVRDIAYARALLTLSDLNVSSALDSAQAHAFGKAKQLLQDIALDGDVQVSEAIWYADALRSCQEPQLLVRARSVMEQCIRYHADNPSAHYFICLLYEEGYGESGFGQKVSPPDPQAMPDLQRALVAAEMAIDKDPRYLEAYYFAGKLSWQLKDTAKAKTYLLRYVGEDKRHGKAYEKALDILKKIS